MRTGFDRNGLFPTRGLMGELVFLAVGLTGAKANTLVISMGGLP